MKRDMQLNPLIGQRLEQHDAVGGLPCSLPGDISIQDLIFKCVCEKAHMYVSLCVSQQ